jgi:hypothetical protein
MIPFANIRFFWCDLHYACVGIESCDNIITDVAPIVKWMKGKTLQQIKPFLKQKNAIVKEIKNNSYAQQHNLSNDSCRACNL